MSAVFTHPRGSVWAEDINWEHFSNKLQRQHSVNTNFGNNTLLKNSDVGSYACQTQKVNSKNITIIYELLVLSINFFLHRRGKKGKTFVFLYRKTLHQIKKPKSNKWTHDVLSLYSSPGNSRKLI